MHNHKILFKVGFLVMIGCLLTPFDAYLLLMDHILECVDIAQGIATPANVEVVHRVQDETDYWFVLNHNPEPQTVTLPTDGLDLLSGRTVTGTIVIAGYDVL